MTVTRPGPRQDESSRRSRGATALAALLCLIGPARAEGAGVQLTFGGSSSPVSLSAAPSLDYLKQEHAGPSQTSASLDLDLQPGGSSSVTPYAGVSAGANWSGGPAKQWEGARLGMEMLAGAQGKLGSSRVSAKGEERFGYVKGQEHTLATRLGVLLSF
jgi:hypothetical protein